MWDDLQARNVIVEKFMNILFVCFRSGFIRTCLAS